MLLEHHHGKFGGRVEISIQRRKIADVPEVRLQFKDRIAGHSI